MFIWGCKCVNFPGRTLRKKNLFILDRAPTTEQSGQVHVNEAVSLLGLLTGARVSSYLLKH